MAKRSEPRHILVINDTPEILDLFQDLLGDAGYRVTTENFSAPYDRKLAQVKEQRPDLIILDFIIGGEAMGWQFLQLLRMDRETRDIPVIACTAAVQQIQELQNHLDEMGVAVVLKPFDIDHLLGEVAKVWEKVELGRFPHRDPQPDDA